MSETVHRVNFRATEACRCCGGLGDVPAADGAPRPCSRCRVAAFEAWAIARRPQRAPAPHADFALLPPIPDPGSTK